MPTAFRKTNMLCSRCNEASPVPVFDSIDLAEASDITRTMALSGKLFLFQCPLCGKKEPISYPMNVFDDDMSCFITVLDADHKTADYRRICRVYQDIDINPDTDRYRIVDTCQELSEKLRIFNDGLDDRIVEIIKIFVCEEVSGDISKIHQVKCIYRKMENGKISFAAKHMSEQADIELSMKNYMVIEQNFAALDDEDFKSAYIINQQWADKVVALMSE